MNGKIDELSYLHINNQHSAAWKTVSELSGKSSKPITTLKGGSREKRLENWFSYFKNLLGKPEILLENKTLPKLQVSYSLNIPTVKFTIAELTQVLKNVKNKARGLVKILAVLWKDIIFHQLLIHQLIFVILLLNTISYHQFGFNLKSYFPKKGDLTIP